ncbi:hypothetical protein N1851_024601 [Merluccius polli]|uniref:Uncharacterized protein n=1 Tax=Merluccius polli TaxID=89951 RepID=A0AA47MEW3_MERPO|nr:hypothetical protein N1851_024601 [Merluccius polli]
MVTEQGLSHSDGLIRISSSFIRFEGRPLGDTTHSYKYLLESETSSAVLFNAVTDLTWGDTGHPSTLKLCPVSLSVCIVDGLYRALGVSAGGEFSSEDVSIIYQKVFHYPSTTDDVLVAIKKVAGEDEGWSCVGENILDVLLEMQKERESKEELYWSQQLLNVGKRHDGSLKDTQDLGYHQGPEHAHSHSGSGSLRSGCNDTDLTQPEDSHRCVLRLKRSARQCWARYLYVKLLQPREKTLLDTFNVHLSCVFINSRLVTEGVHSIAPRRWHATEPEVRSHALGCLTPADLLSLLEVKYDVITRMLYTEMLRQHYGWSAWEALLPWQQDKEKEGLEDLAELALGSGDLLRLSELPGAFRIYKTCEQVFPTGSSESAVQSSWSAVTVLTEAYASRQQERDSLTHLSKRLDRESLKLLFLYIRLATFRAQTEHRSYGALLAARQRWERWPCVGDMCRQEMVAQWLHGDEKEEKEIFISASPQQKSIKALYRVIMVEKLRIETVGKERKMPKSCFLGLLTQRYDQAWPNLHRHSTSADDPLSAVHWLPAKIGKQQENQQTEREGHNRKRVKVFNGNIKCSE